MQVLQFICDKMLDKVGRWLRTAGYDTVIIEGRMTDRQIFEIATEEERILLTCDKRFLEFKNAEERVVFLRASAFETMAKELSQKLKVNWLHKPFSRCIECNTVLKEASESEKKKVPEAIIKKAKFFLACPGCHRTYWEGSHTDRMLERLKDLNVNS